MRSEELMRSLRDKEKRCDRVVVIFSIPLFIAWISIMVCLALEVQFITSVLLVIAIVGPILGSIAFIFGCKADNCRKEIKKHILSVIENVIKMSGVEQNDFEISCHKENVYRVVIINKKVDYEVLRSRLDLIIGEFERITEKHIQVQLV